MKEIPVTNNTACNMHVGGKVIRPGATRMVEESMVPEDLRPSPAEPVEESVPDSMASLVEGGVKDIVEVLQGLSADDLARLEALEQDGKKRKGVLEGIAHERLRRAAEPTPEILGVLEHNVDQIIEVLPAMTLEELDQVEAAELADKARQGVAEAIAHERKRRAEAEQ